MEICRNCTRPVKKLLIHPFTKEQLCFDCISQNGLFEREINNYINIVPDERRTHIRVPLSIVMSFEISDTESMISFSYPALSVDISLSGICFAWKHCKHCTGYEENAVHSKCIFDPYSMNNDYKSELELTFNLSENYSVRFPCYIVYVIKEAGMGIEYVGGRFSDLTTKNQVILETLLIKYGHLK